jgi:hypothetical protein
VAPPTNRVERAGGGKVKVTRPAGKQTFRLDFDVTDILILRCGVS